MEPTPSGGTVGTGEGASVGGVVTSGGWVTAGGVVTSGGLVTVGGLVSTGVEELFVFVTVIVTVTLPSWASSRGDTDIDTCSVDVTAWEYAGIMVQIIAAIIRTAAAFFNDLFKAHTPLNIIIQLIL